MLKQIALSFFLIFCLIVQAAALEPLHIEGNHLATSGGKPITLRGVSLCSIEWQPATRQITELAASKDWPLNVIRLPVQATEWNRTGAEAHIKDYLDPAVVACEKANIYCIIDWHSVADWDKPETTRAAADFWSKVASRYAHNPNILYEIINEPANPSAETHENWLKWRTTAQELVDNLRKNAPDTVLLVGSPRWSRLTGFAANDPLRGSNIVYTAHIYPNVPEHEWNRIFGDASKHVPIMMTEWGWSSQLHQLVTGFYGTRAGYGEPMRRYLDARPQVSWTAWSYDNQCGPAMTGKDNDMGAFVQEWLKAKQ